MQSTAHPHPASHPVPCTRHRFTTFCSCLCRALFESLASLKASTTMHDAMTARVMRAPVGWFEKTPLGRILNRFSSDIQELDKDVMDGLGSTLVCGFSAASIVIVISYTVSSFVFFGSICMGGFLVTSCKLLLLVSG